MKAALKDQNRTSGQDIPPSSQTGTTALVGSQSNNQIPVLDGVRAIACLAVLVFHISLRSTGLHIWKSLLNIHTVAGTITYFVVALTWSGDTGMILFFLLSSFLLFLPYAKALLFDSPWPALRHFYLRRIFRILPGYYTVLFLLALFFHPELLSPRNWQYLWTFLTLRMNFALAGYLDGPIWTLPIEFQFYLLLPILAWFFSLIVRCGTIHWRLLKLTLCLLIMAAWGPLTKYLSLYLGHTSIVDFFIPPYISIALIPYLSSNTDLYFDVFAIGMLICIFYIYTKYVSITNSWCIWMQRISPLMLIVGLALFSFLSFWRFYFINTNSRYFRLPRFYIVFPFLDSHIPSIVAHYWADWQTLGYTLSYACCFLALLYGSAKLKRPFECSLLRWIASISFSLYLWHLPFLSLFISTIGPNLQRQGWNPLLLYGVLWCWTLVIIVPTSIMLYRWIEQPGIRLGGWLIHKLERDKQSRLESSIWLRSFFKPHR